MLYACILFWSVGSSKGGRWRKDGSVLLVTGTLTQRQKFLRKVGNHSSVLSISQEMDAPKQRCENLEQGQSIFQRPTIQTVFATFYHVYEQGVPGLSRGKSCGAWYWPCTPARPRLGAVPLSALCACISMSLGDLYLYLTISMITQLLYNGYQVIARGKATGAWRWPPTPI
jgi:hypothetical protein